MVVSWDQAWCAVRNVADPGTGGTAQQEGGPRGNRREGRRAQDEDASCGLGHVVDGPMVQGSRRGMRWRL